MIYGLVAQTALRDSRWRMATDEGERVDVPRVSSAVIERPLLKGKVGGSIPPRSSQFNEEALT